jgi:hypothetical protein
MELWDKFSGWNLWPVGTGVSLTCWISLSPLLAIYKPPDLDSPSHFSWPLPPGPVRILFFWSDVLTHVFLPYVQYCVCWFFFFFFFFFAIAAWEITFQTSWFSVAFFSSPKSTPSPSCKNSAHVTAYWMLVSHPGHAVRSQRFEDCSGVWSMCLDPTNSIHFSGKGLIKRNGVSRKQFRGYRLFLPSSTLLSSLLHFLH